MDWPRLRSLLAAHQRFVISSHVRPDGDALGSELGLAMLLDQWGKQVRIINPSESPKNLKFLDPEGRILKLGDGVTVESACDADVHLVVDTSAWNQLPEISDVLRRTAAKKVIIDHHVSADDLGADEYKDSAAAATGVLITEFIQYCGEFFTPPQATALFTAIATDTGWFRFPNTDSRTLRAAAVLIDAGARPAEIYRELYERSSLGRLKLQSIALGRVELACAGRIAYSFVHRKDFAETGSHPTDTEDLVNSCLQIAGVEAAFFLVEQPDGRIKASLRSRTALNVAAIAEQFAGGGHRQASGAMLPGPMESAVATLLRAFSANMASPSGSGD